MATITHEHLLDAFKIFQEGFTLQEFELVVVTCVAAPVSVSTEPAANISATLREALRSNWIDELILNGHNLKPGVSTLAGFVEEHFGSDHVNPASNFAVTAPDDPFGVTFLRNNESVPFVNRQPLRTHLRQMFDVDNGPRIMTVHSDLGQCGKSYSAELIRFLARHHDQRSVSIDIFEEWTAEFGPEQLARLLATEIGADTSALPAREAQMARWNRQLCSWINREIKSSGAFWWIVIDGFSKVSNLTTDLLDFIHEMAAVIEKEDRPMYRLVLISLSPEDLPINLRARVIEENIPGHIGKLELAEFFTQQVDRVKANHDLTDADVENVPQVLAEMVLDELTNLSEEERPFALELLIKNAMDQLEATIDQG